MLVLGNIHPNPVLVRSGGIEHTLFLRVQPPLVLEWPKLRMHSDAKVVVVEIVQGTRYTVRNYRKQALFKTRASRDAGIQIQVPIKEHRPFFPTFGTFAVLSTTTTIDDSSTPQVSHIPFVPSSTHFFLALLIRFTAKMSVSSLPLPSIALVLTSNMLYVPTGPSVVNCDQDPFPIPQLGPVVCFCPPSHEQSLTSLQHGIDQRDLETLEYQHLSYVLRGRLPVSLSLSKFRDAASHLRHVFTVVQAEKVEMVCALE
jgi:hypothetical protein